MLRSPSSRIHVDKRPCFLNHPIAPWKEYEPASTTCSGRLPLVGPPCEGELLFSHPLDSEQQRIPIQLLE